MELKDWVGPSISAIAATSSILFALRARRDVKRNQRLQGYGLQRQADADIRRWADDVVGVMSDSLTWTYLPALELDLKNVAQTREDILSCLSAIIDRGRWFFPNERPDDHGEWKAKAYRGFRPAVLDCIVEVFKALKAAPTTGFQERTRTTIIAQRKEFVSLIQTRLDPVTRDNALQDLLK